MEEKKKSSFVKNVKFYLMSSDAPIIVFLLLVILFPSISAIYLSIVYPTPQHSFKIECPDRSWISPEFSNKEKTALDKDGNTVWLPSNCFVTEIPKE